VSPLSGALVGLVLALGVLLVAVRVPAVGPLRLSERLAAHLGPRARLGVTATDAGVASTVEGLARPYLLRAAEQLERLLGGGASVQRRLLRAGSPLDLQGFRVQQVLWAAGCFAAAVAGSLALLAAGSARSPGLLLVFCSSMAAAGVLLRDQQLSREVRAREVESRDVVYGGSVVERVVVM
jgi:tight adherence protein C